MTEYFRPGARRVGPVDPEVVERRGELVPPAVEEAWIEDGATITGASLLETGGAPRDLDELAPATPREGDGR